MTILWMLFAWAIGVFTGAELVGYLRERRDRRATQVGGGE